MSIRHRTSHVRLAAILVITLPIANALAAESSSSAVAPKTPETNPVREAYRLWGNTALVDGPSSWDQVAVLSLARPELFELEHVGRVERKPNGRVVWNPDADNPKHHLVTPKISTEKMAEIIEELMARTPKARASTGQRRAK